MLAILPGLIWGLPLIGLARLVRQRPALGDITPITGVPLSIIIPARNESRNIEPVVRSILASSYHPFELIVVDDRSTDDTATRMAALAAIDPRVRLVAGAELPEGWCGKPWACAQGAAVATGEILLFTDADTWHDPSLHGRAVAATRLLEADLLTLGSHQLCLTFWERVIMPQVMGMLGIRFAPQVVNRATRPDQVVANGQFIMMPRSAYDALGGHHAVRGEVVEDLALAQAVIRAGKRLRMLYSGRLLITRMYRSLGELVEGWSKNLYVGALQAAGDRRLLRAVAPLGLLTLQLFWLLPLIALAAGWQMPAALLAVGLSAGFWLLMAKGMAIPIQYGLAYPLGAVLTAWISLRSLWRGRRRIEWRGRRYRLPPA